MFVLFYCSIYFILLHMKPHHKTVDSSQVDDNSQQDDDNWQFLNYNWKQKHNRQGIFQTGKRGAGVQLPVKARLLFERK